MLVVIRPNVTVYRTDLRFAWKSTPRSRRSSRAVRSLTNVQEKGHLGRCKDSDDCLSKRHADRGDEEAVVRIRVEEIDGSLELRHDRAPQGAPLDGAWRLVRARSLSHHTGADPVRDPDARFRPAVQEAVAQMGDVDHVFAFRVE